MTADPLPAVACGKSSVTKVFRDNPVGLVCLRCGEHLPQAETGRPRQYCGDACRRAGSRLFRRRGHGWWHEQPWYPGWLAERQAWHEKWEREWPERERQAEEARQQAAQAVADERKLRESMPPDVRSAYEQAEARAHRRRLTDTRLGTLRLELETLSVKHEALLGATGHQIRLVDMSRKIERLLHDALYADNEHEAAALFAKARQLRAAGEDLEEPVTGLQLVRKLLADMGGTF